MLLDLLSGQYRTLAYNGNADYSVIRQFKETGEVLISTDNGAKASTWRKPHLSSTTTCYITR